MRRYWYLILFACCLSLLALSQMGDWRGSGEHKPSPPRIKQAHLSAKQPTSKPLLPKITPNPPTPHPEDTRPIAIPHTVHSQERDTQKIKKFIKETKDAIRYSRLQQAEEQVAQLKAYADRNVDYILNFDQVLDAITELETKLDLRKDIRRQGATIRQSNITVEYTPNELHGAAQKILERAIVNREELQSLYGYSSHDSLTILVTDREQLREQQESLPGWATAYYNGSIHLQTNPSHPNIPKLTRQLRHEMLHAHLDKACGDKNLPIWVNEGLAQVFEGRPVASAIAFLQQSLRNSMYDPPEQSFDTGFLHSNNTNSARLYSQSLILVSFVEDQQPGFWQELINDACPSQMDRILARLMRRRLGTASGIALWQKRRSLIRKFMKRRYAQK